MPRALASWHIEEVKVVQFSVAKPLQIFEFGHISPEVERVDHEDGKRPCRAFASGLIDGIGRGERWADSADMPGKLAVSRFEPLR